MKSKLTLLLFFIASVFLAQFANAERVRVTTKVASVGGSWEVNKVCVVFESGDVARLDLDTETGKAELSIALSAKLNGNNVKVIFDDNPELMVGGCDTGTTIQKHYLFTLM